jgi:hypothetical protein
VSNDPNQPQGSQASQGPQAEGQPSEEELRAALQEELKRVRVDQVVLEATISILNVSVMRAGLVPGSEGERDLDQVRVGIEAVRGLLPVVEQIAGEQARPIRDALSQLQMAYVRATEPAGEGERAAGEPSEQGQQGQQGQQGPPRPGERGPAQQSSRLWVPGQ